MFLIEVEKHGTSVPTRAWKVEKSVDEFVHNVLTLLDNEFDCVNSVAALACQTSPADQKEFTLPTVYIFLGLLEDIQRKVLPW